MKYFKKKFRSIKKLPTWLFFLPAMLMRLMLKILYRVRIVDPNNYIENARGLVSVTWHNRLCFFPALFPKNACKRTVAVVSASRDGQYIADLISHLGLKSLRGSSSRGGAGAELAAVRALEAGYNVAFTPDGPRGPKYRMKLGPVHLASLKGTGIIPISINATSYWEVKSWDNFQIPKPFCTLTMILGDALPIPAGLSESELKEYRSRVEKTLLDITVDKQS